jgi:hypothetical protein
MARYTVMLTVLLAFIAGCSKGGGGGMQEQAQAQKIKPADSVFSTQFKEIDKAKGVQQTLMNGASQERQQVDNQAQ